MHMMLLGLHTECLQLHTWTKTLSLPGVNCRQAYPLFSQASVVTSKITTVYVNPRRLWTSSAMPHHSVCSCRVRKEQHQMLLHNLFSPPQCHKANPEWWCWDLDGERPRL